MIQKKKRVLAREETGSSVWLLCLIEAIAALGTEEGKALFLSTSAHRCSGRERAGLITDCHCICLALDMREQSCWVLEQVT
jgi:hypothetical protein